MGDNTDPVWGTIKNSPFYEQVYNMVNIVLHLHTLLDILPQGYFFAIDYEYPPLDYFYSYFFI